MTNAVKKWTRAVIIQTVRITLEIIHADVMLALKAILLGNVEVSFEVNAKLLFTNLYYIYYYFNQHLFIKQFSLKLIFSFYVSILKVTKLLILI